MCIIGLPAYLFSKTDRRVAEQNIHSLSSAWHRTIQEISITPNEVKHLEDKWDIILDGTYLDTGISKEVRKFFKRNNIDLYSKDFDPEYVAKCIKEQEIC